MQRERADHGKQVSPCLLRQSFENRQLPLPIRAASLRPFRRFFADIGPVTPAVAPSLPAHFRNPPIGGPQKRTKRRYM